MVENILIAAGGIGIGIAISGYALAWRRQILAAREELVQQQLVRAESMLATAEQLTVQYNALTQPTEMFETVKPRARVRFSRWCADRFNSVPPTPDWAVGEVRALALVGGTDPVHPDPLPPPPPPSPRRQPWDRHLNRAAWPNASVNPRVARMAARLADLPNPAVLAARLAKLPDPTRVYRTARSC